MFKGTKKLTALVAAFAVAATGFMYDNNAVKADEQKTGDVYYKILRAEGQDNDVVNPGSNLPYYYEGQKFEITGVDFNGTRYGIDGLYTDSWNDHTERVDYYYNEIDDNASNVDPTTSLVMDNSENADDNDSIFDGLVDDSESNEENTVVEENTTYDELSNVENNESANDSSSDDSQQSDSVTIDDGDTPLAALQSTIQHQIDYTYLKDRTPENEGDIIVIMYVDTALNNEYVYNAENKSVSFNIVNNTSVYGIYFEAYKAMKVQDGENSALTLRYVLSYKETVTGQNEPVRSFNGYINPSFYLRNAQVSPLFVKNSNGEVLYSYNPNWSRGDVLIEETQAINATQTYSVLTKNSASKINVVSDNTDVASVEVSGKNFTVTPKKIGVANITITDDANNTLDFQFTVVKPTPANATNTTNASSNNAGASTSSSSSSNVAPAKETPVTEMVTVNSAGQTVRTFQSSDGLYHSSLVSENEVVPTGATFKSTEIEQTAEYYIAINNILTEYWKDINGTEYTHATVAKMVEFDLADMSGAAIHQLDGYVTVSMDMPSDIVMNENQILTVYRVAEDGTVVACPTVVENGVIQFATNHFSTYVFVVSDAPIPTAGDNTNNSSSTKSPKTGEE